MGKEMFTILSDIESASVEIEEALDALALYDENMENAVRGIEPNRAWTSEVFSSRFHLYDSALQVCQNALGNALQKLNKSIEEGIKNCLTEKETEGEGIDQL